MYFKRVNTVQDVTDFVKSVYRAHGNLVLKSCEECEFRNKCDAYLTPVDEKQRSFDDCFKAVSHEFTMSWYRSRLDAISTKEELVELADQFLKTCKNTLCETCDNKYELSNSLIYCFVNYLCAKAPEEHEPTNDTKKHKIKIPTIKRK